MIRESRKRNLRQSYQYCWSRHNSAEDDRVVQKLKMVLNEGEIVTKMDFEDPKTVSLISSSKRGASGSSFPPNYFTWKLFMEFSIIGA